MFSGIIETTAIIKSIVESNGQLVVNIEKPSNFDDLKVGDSISIDGICLTVEKFDESQIQFTIAHETIQVTGWSKTSLLNKKINLERALKVDSRLHGHWVTGHVDYVSEVSSKNFEGDSLIIKVSMLDSFKKLIWKKGSVTLNGVSLTVNEVTSDYFAVCLIPETLRVTNLADIIEGQKINVEFDYMARAVVNFLENSSIENLQLKEIFKGDLEITSKGSYA